MRRSSSSEAGRHSPDLNLSVSYDQIIRRPLLEAAPLGFVNFHAGKLPIYRGRNVVNWALINGETEIGLTAHFMDEGIDTGDILLQRTLPIAWTDTYGDVLSRVVDAFPDLVRDAVARDRGEPCRAASPGRAARDLLRRARAGGRVAGLGRHEPEPPQQGPGDLAAGTGSADDRRGKHRHRLARLLGPVVAELPRDAGAGRRARARARRSREDGRLDAARDGNPKNDGRVRGPAALADRHAP